MQHEQSKTQSNQELEPKPLFVGQIKEENRKKFRDLMRDLSAEYENDTVKNNGDISCICNYDYFDPDGDDIYDEKLLNPEYWVELPIRSACIDIVNQALSLTGYGKYLTDNETILKETHKICCSVNYYDDRTGNQGFHQDSYGRELFVLLIYLDPVHGPEVRLKTTKEFKARINYIDKMDFMPKCFTNKVRELHEYAINQHGITITWDGGSAELNENLVEWITPVNGPGGIVGFLDEMVIHATPLREHREPNGDLLLTILQKMKDINVREEILDEYFTAVEFFKNSIQEIMKKDEGLISIYELQALIEENLPSDLPYEVVIQILYELYDKLEEFEGSGELLIETLQSMQATTKEFIPIQYLTEISVLEDIIKEIIPQEPKHYITKNELQSKILENQNSIDIQATEIILNKLYNLFGALEREKYLLEEDSVSGKLGASQHDMYKSKDSEDRIITHHHTGSNNRRMSVKLNQRIPQLPQATDGVEPSEKRSFLRVWVTAIPN